MLFFFSGMETLHYPEFKEFKKAKQKGAWLNCISSVMSSCQRYPINISQI